MLLTFWLYKVVPSVFKCKPDITDCFVPVGLKLDLFRVSKPLVELSSSCLIGMISTLVCISGPSTGCGALMRGKFVLAKHGQIYEPARLSSAALTTDINIRTLQGDCISWGFWTLPVKPCAVWLHGNWTQMMHFTNHGGLGLVWLFYFFLTFCHSCYCLVSCSYYPWTKWILGALVIPAHPQCIY